ncbi:hypothetical protein FQN55_001931 [Onygenales sp. PD_40]|nr:hypothetical protein FQN55_001931 [Onygenales sp. PD_40]
MSSVASQEDLNEDDTGQGHPNEEEPGRDGILKLSDIPRRTAINQGVDENGIMRLPWNLSEDGETLLPPPAIVALALNEVGRELGVGIATYVPAISMRRTVPLGFPEVFFTGYRWSEQDKENWDQASHSKKFRLISRVRREDDAIALRVVVYSEPQESISFTPEESRMSGAVITYDGRPYVGWYRDYASRRNGDRDNITINIVEHRAWFTSMHCRDNFVVVQRLLQMWTQPVLHGIKPLGDVLDKIDDVNARHAKLVPIPAIAEYGSYAHQYGTAYGNLQAYADAQGSYGGEREQANELNDIESEDYGLDVLASTAVEEGDSQSSGDEE